MDTALWVAQGFLAFVFLMVGAMKLMRSKEQLIERTAVLENFDPNIIKAIGAVEVLGSLGVVLPWLTGILPFLTPLAGIGLMLTMLGAAYFHYGRKEYRNIAGNAVLFLLALFVAYGRFFLVPFEV